MKVLHITASDSNGAGIAALRIVLAQREIGIDAQLLVKQKSVTYPFVIEDYSFKYIDYILNQFLTFIGFNHLFSFLSLRIISHRLFKAADIIHLHNIHHVRMLHPIILPKSKNYVYTLHDMWPITGNCNYNYDLCDKYISGCGNCPLNKDEIDWGFPKMLIDKTGYHWRLKRDSYSKLKIIFTAPSKWLYTMALMSKITADKEIAWIPNCVDADHIKYEKRFQEKNKIPKLLFVGQKIRVNDRKGFRHVYGALNKLDTPHELHVIGKMNEGFQNFFTNGNTKIFYHGMVKNSDMQQFYKKSDILLVPTKQDNFPNTILESVSVGTPVVAFNVGGVADLVDNTCGYLVKKENTDAFRQAIEYVINNLEPLSIEAFKKSKRYSFNKIAQEWKKIYSNSLNS